VLAEQAAASKPVSDMEVAANTHEQAAVSRDTLAAARDAEVCVMRTLQSELRRSAVASNCIQCL